MRRFSAIKSGYWLLIQGALAVIRVIVWIWNPLCDASRAVYDSEASGLRSYDRLWSYDLTETRLVVLWASLHMETPAWLRHAYQIDVRMSDQIGVPKKKTANAMKETLQETNRLKSNCSTRKQYICTPERTPSPPSHSQWPHGHSTESMLETPPKRVMRYAISEITNPQSYCGDQIGVPKWVLPALRPYGQNPKLMFELAKKLRRDNTEWDESLKVLQNAEDFWDMPTFPFMAWVFAWPNSDSSWFDSPGKSFSCRIVRDKQDGNGVQRFHFLPCWDIGFERVITNEDGVSIWFELRAFGVASNRNRCVFALDDLSFVYTNSRVCPQTLVVGCDTPVPGHNLKTPADYLGNGIEEMHQTLDLMWKSLDPILNAVPNQTPTPSSPDAPTEPHFPTDPVQTSQQASPAGSAIELAPLPGANDATQPDADIIRSQPRRRTN